MKKIIFFVALLTLSACNRYVYTLNDQPIYQTKSVFTRYSLVDKALSTCIEQTISDKRITTISELTSLSCTYAGISSIEGLALFTNIQSLDLSNNHLTSIEALFSLTKLSTANLIGNSSVSCTRIKQLIKQTGVSIKKPSHC